MEKEENKNLQGSRNLFKVFYSKQNSNGYSKGMRIIIKYLLLMAITISGLKGSAQDIIAKKDGQIIKAKVVEISETSVLYKYFDNQEGPTYSIKIENIFSLTYENGQQEKFSNSITEAAKPSKQEMNNISRTVLESQIADLESRAETIGNVGSLITTIASIGGGLALSLTTDNLWLGCGVGAGGILVGLFITHEIASPSRKKANQLRESLHTTTNLSIQPTMMQGINGDLAGGLTLSFL